MTSGLIRNIKVVGNTMRRAAGHIRRRALIAPSLLALIGSPLAIAVPVFADTTLPTSFSVVTGPTEPAVGEPTTIEVVSNEVAASSLPLPKALVTFYDGTTPIGTSHPNTVGNINPSDHVFYSVLNATLNYTFQTPGEHDITASFPGDGTYSSFTTAADTVNVTTDASGPVTNWQTSMGEGFGAGGYIATGGVFHYPYGLPISVDSTVYAKISAWDYWTSPVQPTGTVNFTVDGQNFAQIPLHGAPVNSNFSVTNRITMPVLAVGQHPYYSNYLGDTTYPNWTFSPSSFPAENLSIDAGLTRTMLTTSYSNGQVSLSSTVYPQFPRVANGAPSDYCSAYSPNGTVTFYEGTTALATVPVAATTDANNSACNIGAAAASVSLPDGQHNISAVYTSSDTNFVNSTSPTEIVTVTTTPLSINLPQNITVDAVGPSGAQVSYSVSATGGVGTVTTSCTPASGSTFAIGTTTVQCEAKDQVGGVASGSFTVTVTGAEGQIQNLITNITNANAGPGASLSDMLTSVEQDLQATPPKTAEACKQLSAFINHVSAQAGKKLTQAQADSYTAAAKQIEAVLGC